MSPYQPGLWIMRASGIVAGVCLALIVGVTTTQVICRYVFASPLRWPEEFSRVMFIWMTYGGCLLLPHLRQHIAIEFVYDLLPGRWRYLLDLFIDALGVVFFAFLTFSAFVVAEAMAGLLLPALRWPVSALFGFVALAAAGQTYLHLETLCLRLFSNIDLQESSVAEKFRH
jgi:TRAP-type C4-dicarboxylate transport system permease small subunit